MSIITSLLALVGLATTAAYTDLNVDEFEKLIAEEGVVVLDVRTPEEYAEGHIEGALNIDVKAEDFLQKVAALKLDKDARLAVYCRSGRRSVTACNLLSEEGYWNLSNLSTGILGWIDAGKAVKK